MVDYKTGVRKFNLSDVWYGMGMQMLIYLFALKRMGGGRYGKEIIPAGVLYAPARDVIVQAPHDLDDDELESRRIRSSQRSGLLLNDKIVLEAMERAYGAGVLPVKVNKDGNPIGDSLASLEQLGKLSNRVDKLIGYMGDELINGSVRADPYYKSQIDNACIYCDYFEACRFADGNGEDRARHIRNDKARFELMQFKVRILFLSRRRRKKAGVRFRRYGRAHCAHTHRESFRLRGRRQCVFRVSGRGAVPGRSRIF